MQESISYFVIVVAALVPMILGMIWYGPLFGKKWMVLKNISAENIESAQRGMWRAYLASFLANFIMAFVLSLLVLNLELQDMIRESLLLGFLLWLGISFSTRFANYLWEPEGVGKKFPLFLIDTGYFLVSILMMMLVISLWI